MAKGENLAEEMEEAVSKTLQGGDGPGRGSRQVNTTLLRFIYAEQRQQ